MRLTDDHRHCPKLGSGHAAPLQHTRAVSVLHASGAIGDVTRHSTTRSPSPDDAVPSDNRGQSARPCFLEARYALNKVASETTSGTGGNGPRNRAVLLLLLPCVAALEPSGSSDDARRGWRGRVMRPHGDGRLVWGGCELEVRTTTRETRDGWDGWRRLELGCKNRRGSLWPAH